MPSSWPIVMTPVPPTPGDDDAPRRLGHGSAGSGSAGSATASGRAAPPFFALFSWPPSTVTKLGQKPFTQE